MDRTRIVDLVKRSASLVWRLVKDRIAYLKSLRKGPGGGA